ncbi:MAG: integrase core domain-containing protein, partial [Alphaproteobacteria bacterium]|nr:integrase core domain-containing protein [Alphaproteobacteria bacterium]
AEAKTSIGSWICFYNEERSHQSLNYQTPQNIFAAGAYGYDGQRCA